MIPTMMLVMFAPVDTRPFERMYHTVYTPHGILTRTLTRRPGLYLKPNLKNMTTWANAFNAEKYAVHRPHSIPKKCARMPEREGAHKPTGC